MNQATQAAKTVVDFYVLCAGLKDIIRTGWKVWNVKRERLESVAEHIFGVQQLAIAMWSQYNYAIDIYKVIMMLALHEMEEIVIGDLTQWDISRQDKIARGHDAIQYILKDLIKRDEIEKLILEFDARQTPEAKFAYNCDKLECDIQSKLYDESGSVDLTKQDQNPIMHDAYVQELLKKKKSWSGMWLEYGRTKNNYDPNFTDVSNYVEQNKISLLISKKTK
ncbi:HD domain-containing protein [bacterium]|nr:HD domain-containing protein [bacterium]